VSPLLHMTALTTVYGDGVSTSQPTRGSGVRRESPSGVRKHSLRPQNASGTGTAKNVVCFLRRARIA